jgi:hypothetical protein
MVTVRVDMTRFNRGLAGLIQKARLNAQTVVRKETGELIKTLVKVTPKAEPNRIRIDVNSKFESTGMSDYAKSQLTGGIGVSTGSGVFWYQATRKFLFGVTDQSLDMRGASADELMKLSYELTAKGRRTLDFKYPRKSQRVLLSQKVLVKQATLKKVIAEKIRRRGRLAAAWLVSVSAGRIKLTGGNQPPEFVMRHASGAMGRYIDGTGDEKKPRFEIANSAPGVQLAQVKPLVAIAVNVRAKAMAENLRYFMRGKKRLSDYA